ncbi:MAG TPA: protein kinase [Micropepsaceae bacterium]|jgi:serine/threonine protein kinase
MSVEHFQALAKGVRLNQYEMLGILGAGGFGITYMARDTTLDALVAIKEYLPGDFAVRQGDSQVTAKSSTSKGDFDWGLSAFLDEARVLAKFRHPNIVHVNQIFEANNTAYIVMEYAKGETLDALLKRAGTLKEPETKDILFPILDGLKRVHALGFLHRDIKPANIIIREEGGAVLIDFGAARQAIETKSRAITSIVTEGYAPLEQYDTTGHQGAWTDIYALGGVAYKCLTGNKPPPATSRLRNDPLIPLAIAAKKPVSKEFASAIETALQVFENQRPQSIDEFAARISGIIPAGAPPSDAEDATRVMKPEAPRAASPVSQVPVSLAPVSLAPVSPARDIPAAPPSASPVTPRRSMPGMLPAVLGLAASLLLALTAVGWLYLRGPSPSQTAASQSAATQSVAIQNAVTQSAGAVLPSPEIASVAPSPPVPSVAAPKPDVAANPPASRPAPSPALPPHAEAPKERQAAQAIPAPPPAPAFRPSFDCAKAGNDAERLVCTDSQLAALDVTMADLYQLGLKSVTDTNEFRGEQVGWLTQRDVCADKQCLVVSYNDRIKDLQRWVRH